MNSEASDDRLARRLGEEEREMNKLTVNQERRRSLHRPGVPRESVAPTGKGKQTARQSDAPAGQQSGFGEYKSDPSTDYGDPILRSLTS